MPTINEVTNLEIKGEVAVITLNSPPVNVVLSAPVWSQKSVPSTGAGGPSAACSLASSPSRKRTCDRLRSS